MILHLSFLFLIVPDEVVILMNTRQKQYCVS